MKFPSTFPLLILPASQILQPQSRKSNVFACGDLNISAGVAVNLLVHKADLACPQTGMPARVTGTVVVAFEIDSAGNVLHASVVSRPAMLRKPVLGAVCKYKYKPYILGGKAVDVETTVSVAVDNYRDCHIE